MGVDSPVMMVMKITPKTAPFKEMPNHCEIKLFICCRNILDGCKNDLDSSTNLWGKFICFSSIIILILCNILVICNYGSTTLKF